LEVDFVVCEQILEVDPLELVGLLAIVGCSTTGVLDDVLENQVTALVLIEPSTRKRRSIGHDEEAGDTNNDCDETPWSNLLASSMLETHQKS